MKNVKMEIETINSRIIRKVPVIKKKIFLNFTKSSKKTNKSDKGKRSNKEKSDKKLRSLINQLTAQNLENV